MMRMQFACSNLKVGPVADSSIHALIHALSDALVHAHDAQIDFKIS